MGEKKPIERDYYMEEQEFDLIVDKYRHGVGRGSNYLFLDGHVDLLEPKEAVLGLDPWDINKKEATSKPTP
jgi:prepilin-type processing-associated H-X9-DG protein